MEEDLDICERKVVYITTDITCTYILLKFVGIIYNKKSDIDGKKRVPTDTPSLQFQGYIILCNDIL